MFFLVKKLLLSVFSASTSIFHKSCICIFIFLLSSNLFGDEILPCAYYRLNLIGWAVIIRSSESIRPLLDLLYPNIWKFVKFEKSRFFLRLPLYSDPEFIHVLGVEVGVRRNEIYVFRCEHVSVNERKVPKRQKSRHCKGKEREKTTEYKMIFW